jgi:hypothetical protein
MIEERKKDVLLLRGARPVTTESAETLPKTLPGVVCAQWRKCGKAGCRCARGELHGPYFARFWRQGGHLRKSYVRKRDLDDVRQGCLARRQARQECQVAMQKIRELTALLKEVERT